VFLNGDPQITVITVDYDQVLDIRVRLPVDAGYGVLE
jgi:hypothetical protein